MVEPTRESVRLQADALGDVRCRRTLRGQRYDTRKVYDLCWGRKNRVLSASQEGMLVLWNAETGAATDRGA